VGLRGEELAVGLYFCAVHGYWDALFFGDGGHLFVKGV
jgi:uncharacterized membrane protein YoaK (UPF0700 family)